MLIYHSAEREGSLIEHTFIGRVPEMETLSYELMAEQAGAISIVGEAGMGKTAIAHIFGQRNRAFFTGGVHHLLGLGLDSIRDKVESHVPHSSAPYLIILDELDSHRPEALRTELLEMRRDRPSARIICISRQLDLTAAVNRTIELSGLKRAASLDLLVRSAGLLQATGSKDDLLNVLTGSTPTVAQLTELSQSRMLSPRDVIMLLRGFTQSGIVDLDGNPIRADAPESQKIIVDLCSINDRLLEHVQAKPGLLYELSSRRFEELVAELLSRLGYSITLTPASKDGGKDIYAARKDALGSFLFIVECKKYAPDNPIGVGLIRQLNGVVEAERATAGILATTSFFTSGAQEFQRTIPNRMSLKDYFGIQEWLREALGRR